VVVLHRAERCGTNEVAIFVVVRSAVIPVRVNAPLCGVTFPDKILPVKIREEHFLVAIVKRVQLRVRVLLALAEGGCVVLKSIVVPVSKKSRAEIDVVEDKPAEVGVERLIAG